jgi:hypothetical protein
LQTLALSDPKVDTVLITSGFSLSNISDGWNRTVDVPFETLSFKARYVPNLSPKNTSFPFAHPKTVQKRTDGKCTTLKFAAWDLVEYDAFLLADSDVCFDEDVYPFLIDMFQKERYFLASAEGGTRGWVGLNTHMVYAKPDVLLGKIMRDKASAGTFLPYTNTEQDVLETMFDTKTAAIHAEFPSHAHSKRCQPKK